MNLFWVRDLNSAISREIKMSTNAHQKRATNNRKEMKINIPHEIDMLNSTHYISSLSSLVCSSTLFTFDSGFVLLVLQANYYTINPKNTHTYTHTDAHQARLSDSAHVMHVQY